jgi:hypothetical protein
MSAQVTPMKRSSSWRGSSLAASPKSLRGKALGVVVEHHPQFCHDACCPRVSTPEALPFWRFSTSDPTQVDADRPARRLDDSERGGDVAPCRPRFSQTPSRSTW